MTAGNELDQEARRALVLQAEKRHGIRRERKDIDLRGAVYAGGGEIDLQPTWFGMPGADAAAESERLAAKVKRAGRGNSATFSLLESFARAYKEPSLFVFDGPYMDLERSRRLDDHYLTRTLGLLRNPNPAARLTMANTQSAIARTKLAAGDFYLVKARTGGGDILTNTKGAVARLWPVWPIRMKPARHAKGSGRPSNGWIDFYAYDIGRGRPIQVPPENVIHFKNGMRDDEPQRGIGVVDEFALEVTSDIEAALLIQAILTNLGIPGLVFSPEPGTGGGMAAPAGKMGIPSEDREEIKASIVAKTSGKRRGEPIVLSRPTRFEQFQVDLDRYNLEHVWQHVETRLAAVVGWPAILAGLQAGLEAATYSNAASLRRFATENASIPTWEDDSETWTLALHDDFGLRPNEYIAYDYRQVRALQEDREALWKRVADAWSRNLLTLGQACQLIDQAVPEGHDPDARFADVQASAQLRNLLGPALGKSRSFLVDGDVVRPAPILIDGKAAAKWEPDDTDHLTADELDEGDPSASDVAASVATVAGYIADLDADMAGVLGAEVSAEKVLPGVTTKKPRGSWGWDEAAQRFRWPAGGTVSESRVFELREALVDASKARHRAIAQQYLDGDIGLKQMQKRMRQEYTQHHTALRALGRGGEKQLTRADREAIGAAVRRENGHLAGFARKIADGKLTEAQILANAEAYAGGSYRQSFALGRMAGHKAAGFNRKARLTRDSEQGPCDTCKREAAQGYVHIDKAGWVIGDTDCTHEDRCDIVFGKEEEED